ncbi:Cof-type HAD-IIB family hydrolase [Lichenibacterium ramalinae]|uniref:Cof-type HAD-IIB family hydrolase n=1 Tax=Lichenibacterium ramalinae TaxID=2316527 RepID=UPI0013ECFE46|nr:Cof-type HAD-IIB family hydrolase [Lichenibacterium ramalinae]
MSDGPRPAEPIRLVVSDIDGTLVNHAKELTPRTRAAIAALERAGIGFTVTTARPPVGLRPIYAMLGLQVTAAAINGGAIVDGAFNVIAEKLLAPDVARRAVAFLRGRGLDPWLFTDTHWYLRDPDGDNVGLETRTIGQDPVVVEDFGPELYGHVLKVIGSCNDHALLARCETDLQRELGGDAIATRSQSYYLDVTNPAAHKGEAVKSLAEAFGVPVSAVLTIGDGTNDIPMLQAAGFGVAMGNGSEAVKAAARAVTDDCENDGFAKAIELYALGSQGASGRS